LVRMDPRVKTPAAVLAQAHAIALRLYDDIRRDSVIVAQIGVLRGKLGAAKQNAAVADAVNAFEQRLIALAGQGGGGGGRGGGRGRGGAVGGQVSLSSIAGDLTTVMNLLEGTDVAPTTQAL